MQKSNNYSLNNELFDNVTNILCSALIRYDNNIHYVRILLYSSLQENNYKILSIIVH